MFWILNISYSCPFFMKGYRFFDNLRRIWETSLFRLRFISRVPFSMQVKQTLKSQVKPSWKTNLHGYTALTASPQQSQNRCFMTSTLRDKRWRRLKGKFLAQKCWKNGCIYEHGYITMWEVCTRALFSWWLTEFSLVKSPHENWMFLYAELTSHIFVTSCCFGG